MVDYIGIKSYNIIKDSLKKSIININDIYCYIVENTYHGTNDSIKGRGIIYDSPSDINIMYKKFDEVKDNNFYNMIKYQHLICIKNKGGYQIYRKISYDKTSNTIILIDIINNNISHYDNTDTFHRISIILDKDTQKNICILSIPIITMKNSDNIFMKCSQIDCSASDIFHGTSYQFPNKTPYNLYGNWFTFGIKESIYNQNMSDTNDRALSINKSKAGESVSYIGDQNNLLLESPGYIYNYNLKKESQVFLFRHSVGIEYLLIHLMYFDVTISQYTDTLNKDIILKTDGNCINPEVGKNNSIVFKNNFTVRNKKNQISKYNYTLYKNLINLSQPIPPFSNSWNIILSETGDDGDKPLAGKLCDIANSKMIDNNINITGWLVQELTYLMSCNPSDILDFKGIYININNIFDNMIYDKQLLSYIKNILIELLKTHNFSIVNISSIEAIYITKENIANYLIFQKLYTDMGTFKIDKLTLTSLQKKSDNAIYEKRAQRYIEIILMYIKNIAVTEEKAVTSNNFFNYKSTYFDLNKFKYKTPDEVFNKLEELLTKYKTDKEKIVKPYLQSNDYKTYEEIKKQILKKENKDFVKKLEEINTEVISINITDQYDKIIKKIALYKLDDDKFKNKYIKYKNKYIALNSKNSKKYF